MEEPNNFAKWRYSIYSTILFFILSLPLVYKLLKTVDKNGCPTIIGVTIHAIVFLLIIRGMMELKNI
jgi:uncharacterized BrkB/YihY/UPF0761 family membrane protein